jgi:hypothetical protein
MPGEQAKLRAVYYPSCRIKTTEALVHLCLYYDEVHLTAISDDARDPTSYLKRLRDDIKIGVIGKAPSEAEVAEYVAYYRFALDVKPLLGEVIFYRPSLQVGVMGDLVARLMKDGVSEARLLEVIKGETAEQKALSKFCRENPGVSNEVVLRSAPTALYVANHEDMMLVGDDPTQPFPVISERVREARFLAATIAAEAFSLLLPRVLTEVAPQQILDLRGELGDWLRPFRLAMQQLAAKLRPAVKDTFDADELRREARFVVETEIEPTVNELRRRIGLERDKWWRRAFGETLQTLPVVGRAFAAPSADTIFAALQKTSSSVRALVDARQDTADGARISGLGYLIKADELAEALRFNGLTTTQYFSLLWGNWSAK